MTKLGKWAPLTGALLHYLIGALLIMAGVAKLTMDLGPVDTSKPIEAAVRPHIPLIAVGEIITALILILPWTASLGVLLTSSFWGGAILMHMLQNESYLAQSAFLLLTWAAAFLRLPAMFSSFSPELARQS